MRRLYAIIVLMVLMPLAVIAGGNDSVWVKVPVAAVDSVWVKVPAATGREEIVVSDVQAVTVEVADTAAAPATASQAQHDSNATAGKPWSRKHQEDPRRVLFSWGAEAGTSIDMSESDMSSVDFNATFGLRYRWINFAGVGAGANIMVSNSSRTYPVFAVFRTDFASSVNFLFLDLRGGAALNYLPGNVSQTGAYGSAAIGFVLATGKTFRSYITAGYTYIGRRDVELGGHVVEYKPLSMVSIRLGISF